MGLLDLLQVLQGHQHLRDISTSQVLRLFALASLLKCDILLAQPLWVSNTCAPSVLPPSIASFLADSVGISNVHMGEVWDIFKYEV